MKKTKCAAEDYTAFNLPDTRKEVFAMRYKEHFSLIFRLGLLILLFILPIVFITIARDVYIISAASSGQADEVKVEAYYAGHVVYGLIQVPAFTLFCALFSGVVQILRQLIWDEPVFFWDDFKSGLKSNGVRYGVAGFIIAVLNCVLSPLSGSVMTSVLYDIFVVFILPLAIWLSLHGIYYKLGIAASVKNAFIFYIKTLPVTFLLLVLTVVPFWLVTNLMSPSIVKYATIIALTAFYVIPLTMCWMLYASSIFDKYINKEHYPEFYRRGMRKKEDQMQ